MTERKQMKRLRKNLFILIACDACPDDDLSVLPPFMLE
jgi:hypothetical protein